MPQNQVQAPVPGGGIKQKILFVSGKGGVGKSLVAAAVARREAEAGRRVLLVEIGDLSYFKDLFHLERVGHSPVRVPGQGFDLAIWNGESCLREYVLHYLKLRRLYHVFFENRVIRALINIAPGLNEIAILGKITSGIRKVGPPLDYDLIIVDCYATGHALALLGAPRGLMEAVKIGPMGAQSREIDSVLRDPDLTAFWIVTLLEEMPVAETLEFYQRLQEEFGIQSEVIVNKYLQLPISERELETIAEGDAQGLGEFARYLGAVAERQGRFLKALEKAGAPLRKIPLIFTTETDCLIREAEEALRTT